MSKRVHNSTITESEPKKLKLSLPKSVCNYNEIDAKVSLANKCKKIGNKIIRTVKKVVQSKKRSAKSQLPNKPQSLDGSDVEQNSSECSRYQKAWENEEIFKGWLVQHSEFEYRCNKCDFVKGCQNSYLAKRSNVLKHAKSKAHEKSVIEWRKNHGFPAHGKYNETQNDFSAKTTTQAIKGQSLPPLNSMNNSFESAVLENDCSCNGMQGDLTETQKSCIISDSVLDDNSEQSLLSKNTVASLVAYDVDESMSFETSSNTDLLNEIKKTSTVLSPAKQKFSVATHKKMFFASRKDMSFDKKAKKFSAELRFCAMIACKDKAFVYGEELLKFSKSLFSDSETARLISLDRKKIPAILERVFVPIHKEKKANILRKTFFALGIDEMKDKAGHASICIVVRYPDDKMKKIHDTLWDLVPAYNGDENNAEANAEYITETVLQTFRDAEIPLGNIIAFCADTCPLMMGIKNGVAARLKKYIPHIQIVSCDCHIENLITRDAMKKLPQEVMDLISAMPKHIKASAKKKHTWKNLQEKLDLDPLELLEYARTRWLSRYSLILRSSRRWEPLTIYFEREVLVYPSKKGNNDEDQQEQEEKEKKTPEWILTQLQDPLMYTYALFLEAMLSRLARLNLVLQAERPIISNYRGTMADLYVDFLQMYMEESYIENTPLKDIDPQDVTHFKPLFNLYIGQNTYEHLTSEPPQFDLEDFLKVCQSFQIEICTKIKEKCNFECFTYFFNKYNALDSDFHRVHQNLNKVFDTFPQLNVDRDIVNNEWACLISHEFPKATMETLKKINRTDEFWYFLKDYKDPTINIFLFQNLATLALYILCRPNSNAACERVWSKYNREMTNERASLYFTTVRATLLASQYVCDEGGILEFRPSMEMLNKMNKTIVYARAKKKKPTLDADADKTVFGPIELTEARKQRSLRGELLFSSPYTDLKPIDFEEINILASIGNLSENNNTKNLYGENELEKKGPIILDIQEISNNFESTVDFALENNIVYYVDDNNELIMINDKTNGSLNCVSNQISVENIVHPETLQFQSINNREPDIEVFGASIFDIGLTINDEKTVDNRIRLDATCKAVSDDDFCIKKLDNHLVNDVHYYLSADDSRLFGRYKTDKSNHPLRDRRTSSNTEHNVMPPEYELKFFVKEYKTLMGNEWIDGQIIDAFCHINEKYWRNAIFLPSEHAKLLLIDIDECADSWFMFHVKHQFKGKIFMPYSWHGHWCLFVVDVDRCLTFHIDPKYLRSVESVEYKEMNIHRAKLVHNNFLKYLVKLGMYTGDENNLHTIQWTNVYCADARLFQWDGVNCGAFLMNLMDHIGRDIIFEMMFDPSEYREYVLHLLLKYSKSMEQFCLYCYSTKNNRTREEIFCMYCERFAHVTCRLSVEIDGTVTYPDFDGSICASCKNYCHKKNVPIDGNVSEKSSQESNTNSDKD